MILGATVVPPRVIPRIFTYIKKLTRYPRTRTRFWVNAQCAYLVTRKPLNVRMGKGKGAKVRFYTYIKTSTPLAAVSALRGGLRKKLIKFIRIRLGRPGLILNPVRKMRSTLWTQRHRVQTKMLRERAAEIKMLLTFTRRPVLKTFFSRLFRAAWRRPRLRWRSYWPSLPKISAKLKARRKRWGSGSRFSSPVWAGLASLMGSVVRTKTSLKRTLFLRKKAYRFAAALRHFGKKQFGRLKPGLGLSLFVNKNSLILKVIFFKILRSQQARAYTSLNLFLPFKGATNPLQGFWAKRGFKLLLKLPCSLDLNSLPFLLPRIVASERACFLLLANLSVDGQSFLIQGASLLRDDDQAANAESLNQDVSFNPSHYFIREGFIEPWLTNPLEPFLATQVLFLPFRRLTL